MMKNNLKGTRQAEISASLNYQSMGDKGNSNNEDLLAQKFRNRRKMGDFCLVQSKLPSKTTRAQSSTTFNSKSVSLINQGPEAKRIGVCTGRLISSNDKF
jgi:hypothetical protein